MNINMKIDCESKQIYLDLVHQDWQFADAGSTKVSQVLWHVVGQNLYNFTTLYSFHKGLTISSSW